MYDYLKKFKLRIDLVWMFVIPLMVFFLILMAISSYFCTGKADNIYEETAEKIIFYQTGFDIDLSPFSPE